MSAFNQPSFDEGSVELRIVDDEVCIYATPAGLKHFAELCLTLLGDHPQSKTSHIHLEDYEILTRDSKRGVVAVFRNQSNEPPNATE